MKKYRVLTKPVPAPQAIPTNYNAMLQTLVTLPLDTHVVHAADYYVNDAGYLIFRTEPEGELPDIATFASGSWITVQQIIE